MFTQSRTNISTALYSHSGMRTSTKRNQEQGRTYNSNYITFKTGKIKDLWLQLPKETARRDQRGT